VPGFDAAGVCWNRKHHKRLILRSWSKLRIEMEEENGHG
jgi:hypothetical protein